MKRRGFSLLEILLSISLIVIIGGIAISVMNPGGQLAKARNSQREAHLQTILNGIRLNSSENRTGWNCAAGPLPTSTPLRMASPGTSTYDIASCLVPVYIKTFPIDPSFSGAYYNDASDYDSGYTIQQNSTTLQVTLTAPAAELGATVSITR